MEPFKINHNQWVHRAVIHVGEKELVQVGQYWINRGEVFFRKKANFIKIVDNEIAELIKSVARQRALYESTGWGVF